MTPKEKAQDLVNRYRAILMNENTDCGEEILCTTIAFLVTPTKWFKHDTRNTMDYAVRILQQNFYKRGRILA